MSQQTPRPILFLGATGGCANSALVHTLQSLPGTPCIALARTPSKITTLLSAQNLTPSQLSNLTIIPGNATSTTDLKTALTAHHSGQLPRTIVTALGGAPKMEMKWGNPITIDQPNVCEQGARALVQAVREVLGERRRAGRGEGELPSVVYVSTTGVSRVKEDVPFAMRWLYHQVLAVPHRDKRAMEDVLMAGAREGGEGQEKGERVFRVASGVRPTLLAGLADVSDGRGWSTLRAGRETSPEMGYSVKRADVGEWVFETFVREGSRREEWEGEVASLTS